MAVKQDDLLNMLAKPRKMMIWKTQRHSFYRPSVPVCIELQAKSDNRTDVENKRLFTKTSTPLVRMEEGRRHVCGWQCLFLSLGQRGR